MRKNYVLKLGALALAVSLITTGMMGTTLARYADEAVGEGTVAVAKWNVTLNKPTEKTFTLAGTKKTNGNVGADVVAPGDTGVLAFSITDKGTDVAYKYSITVDANELSTAGVNIKFFTDEKCETSWTDIKNVEVKLAADSQKTPEMTETGKIYWKWVEDNTVKEGENRNNDTLAGVVDNTDLKFTVTLSAEQIISESAPTP